MRKHRYLFLLWVCASLLLVAPTSRAQDWGDVIPSNQRPSHIIIIDGGTSADAENLLRSRLHLAQKNTELEKLAADIIRDPDKYHLDKADLRKLAARQAGSGNPLPHDLDPSNPEVKKALQQALEGRSATIPDGKDEEARRIGEQLHNLANRQPDSRFPPPPLELKPLPPPSGMPPHPTPGNTMPSTGNGPQPSMSRPAQAPSSPTTANNSRWLRSFTNALGNSPLTDSDSLRAFVATLAENRRSESSTREERKFGENPLGKSLGGLDRHLPGKFDLPDLKWSAPRTDIRTPSPRPSADINGESVGMVASIIVLVALSVLAAWGLWRFGPPTRWRRAGKTEGLGPWPVSPHAVHTRAELIRAFEYLAVLLLGRAARSLNHLDIAVGLVNREPERRDAADRLAHAYEQARYAPPDEPLPEEELLAARRDLCLLAGAAAV